MTAPRPGRARRATDIWLTIAILAVSVIAWRHVIRTGDPWYAVGAVLLTLAGLGMAPAVVRRWWP